MHAKNWISFFIGVMYISSYSQEPQSKTENDSIIIESNIYLEDLVVESKQILQSKFNARNRTGSAYYISPEEIKKMGYTDINRMLKAVPGVNVYEEDGYGLRPNISLRGTKAERSEKITIMEDGILASPAPYAAPAAYYFPNAARMHAVEVVKGSSQVQYGPFTTGGAVNMVSTPIPNKFQTNLHASYGTNNTIKTHASVGNKHNHFGYLVEYLNFGSDGFKSFEDGEHAGFKRNDFISKFIIQTKNEKNTNHTLELKFGYTNEDSDETYVGLSEEDFKINPYLRYAGSRKDRMLTEHQQWVATYLVKFSQNKKLTTNAYYNKFHRNWYKLNDVRVGATNPEKRSIGQVLEDPETNFKYFDLLTGNADYVGEGLIVRANNRDYASKGIQTKFDYKYRLRKMTFDMQVGLRYHYDYEDRFQWDDAYAMVNKEMKLFLPGIHGTNANRKTSAKALATYLLNKFTYKKISVTAGVRYEIVSLLKKDYTKQDLRRTGKIRIEVKNNAIAFIPSLGINYKFLDGFSLFSGVHKGFSPPSAATGQKPESSINIETGLRYGKNEFSTEVIGFYNYFNNMLGSNLAAAGGTGDLNQFDIGKAKVKGAELLFRYQPNNRNLFKFPFQISYTYTDTEMLNAFQENSWGYVFEGDEIPYVNKHSANLSFGVNYKYIETNVGVRYNGDMRTKPGQGTIAEREKVPSHFIIDATVKTKVHKYISISLNVINLTNKAYLVSRHPSGLRAGHPFGIFTGINIIF
ncbi:MAG: TonB-dependent receptor family protein [Weeksellaceae bacterium]